MGAFFLSSLDTVIHEHCHWLATVIAKRSTAEFSHKLRTTIYHENKKILRLGSTALTGALLMYSVAGICFGFEVLEIAMYLTSKKNICDRNIVAHPERYCLDEAKFMEGRRWYRSWFCKCSLQAGASRSADALVRTSW